MEIKRAGQESIEDVIELRMCYFREIYQDFSEEEQKNMVKNLRTYFQNHLNEDCIAVLAYDGGRAVSSAILNIITKAPNRRFPNGRFGEIYGVYTKKEARKNGYATALIRKLIEVSDSMDLSYLELGASADGKPVYERCGFVEEESEYTEMIYRFHS